MTPIKLIQRNSRFYVSSKEVAKHFGKRHGNVLRDLGKLQSQLPESFRRINFDSGSEPDSQGIHRKVIWMTRDGFALFALTGADNLLWKVQFLEAFNGMEQKLVSDVPKLEREVRDLKAQLQKQRTGYLPPPKKPHGNTGLVLVPVEHETIFGKEIVYKRVPKESPVCTKIARKEGEVKRLTNITTGNIRKLTVVTDELVLLRRTESC